MKGFYKKACFVSLALFTACSGKKEEPPPPEPKQSVPLAVGNWWIYQDAADPGKFDTTMVLYDTTCNGYPAFAVFGYLMGNKDTTIVYYADSNLNMVYTFTFQIIEMTVEGVLMPEYLTKGQVWKVGEDSISGINLPGWFDSTDVVILSIWGRVEDSVSLSVPAGSFDPSFVIHYEDTIFKNSRDTLIITIKTYSWVSPGTGIIARDENGDSEVIPTARLYDYEIK
ncbi:MAG: hypothetical protein ABIM46_00330 [candidate division WOR-3 bacterium]